MARSDINTVTLVGRLVRDPEQAYLPSGTSVANFSIANNYYNPNQENAVNYFDVAAFGKLADVCAQYLRKGKQVAVCGELRQDRWTDKTTGKTQSRVRVIVSDLQMLGGRDDASGGGSGSGSGSQAYGPPPRQSAPPPQQQQQQPAPPPPQGVELDDDVPF